MNNLMEESRHDKAWNDPPLFSLDQMSQTGKQSTNRRNRYPQMTDSQPFAANTGQMGGFGAAQQFGANPNASNTFANSGLKPFDLNNFMIALNYLTTTLNNLPHELKLQLPVIQHNLLNVQLDSQTQINLNALSAAIQMRDFNAARSYSNLLAQDSRDNIRTTANILCHILNFAI